MTVIDSVTAALAKLPEVSWDRWGGELDWCAVFGWLPREDGRHDFVQLTFDNGKCVGFATSSSARSAEFAARLGIEGHCDCKRVEHWFPVRNCIRLETETTPA